ncbi:hypothetical protein F2Q69_00002294 [Brassica cretica]|uniref:Uncharacterized protein n=1 Tax=Brassica cretica TaxID=69181 RepID=A0A8S9P3N5_BRACR|nr:hypothetical protein F2Q69_00002294 [Brassica cretica]
MHQFSADPTIASRLLPLFYFLHVYRMNVEPPKIAIGRTDPIRPMAILKGADFDEHLPFASL